MNKPFVALMRAAVSHNYYLKDSIELIETYLLKHLYKAKVNPELFPYLIRILT